MIWFIIFRTHAVYCHILLPDWSFNPSYLPLIHRVTNNCSILSFLVLLVLTDLCTRECKFEKLSKPTKRILITHHIDKSLNWTYISNNTKDQMDLLVLYYFWCFMIFACLLMISIVQFLFAMHNNSFPRSLQLLYVKCFCAFCCLTYQVGPK